MQMLHAAAASNGASFLELRFCTCSDSIPAPFAINGKSAPIGTMPWKPKTGHSVQAATCFGRECFQSHSTGAGLDSALTSLAFRDL
jgi:hypothetical protein